MPSAPSATALSLRGKGNSPRGDVARGSTFHQGPSPERTPTENELLTEVREIAARLRALERSLEQRRGAN
jgi:hypothetical protein